MGPADCRRYMKVGRRVGRLPALRAVRRTAECRPYMRAALRAQNQRKKTISSSPNMLMKKIRSVLPVAGPRAEKANIRKPERKRCGRVCGAFRGIEHDFQRLAADLFHWLPDRGQCRRYELREC